MPMTKTPLRAIKTLKKRREKVARLEHVVEKNYPPLERIGFKTWLKRFLWRHAPAMKRPHTKYPIRTGDYKNFYRWVALRTAQELLKHKGKRPVIIMIGGVAGSGKSTIAERLGYMFYDIFEPIKPKIAVIPLDGYFKQREITKITNEKGEVIREISKIGGKIIPGEFDNPEASDLKRAINDIKELRQGKSVTLIIRDVKTGKINTEVVPQGIDIIIVEGLYSLHKPFAELADMRIGILVPLGKQFLVRATRDISERQRDPTAVARKFASRVALQRDFVISDVVKNSDIILDRTIESPGINAEIWATAVPGSAYYMKFLSMLGLSESKTLMKLKGHQNS
ncbi:MAG: hypothetical protein QXM75_02405 [Candidatus Diapherotrites archaeon]